MPLGEQPAQLWALSADLRREFVDAAAPIRTRRLLGLRLARTAFRGLLAVSDEGAWW